MTGISGSSRFSDSGLEGLGNGNLTLSGTSAFRQSSQASPQGTAHMGEGTWGPGPWLAGQVGQAHFLGGGGSCSARGL